MISRYVCTVGINEVSRAGCVGVRRPGAGDPPGPGDHRHQDQGGGGHRGDTGSNDPNLQAAQAED